MEVTLLLIVSAIYTFCCWLTYSEESQKQWWYLPVGTFFGAIITFIWYFAAKQFGDKDRMYTFNLMWDSIMLLIYYSLPLLFFGAKLDRWGCVALTLIVLGIIVLKLKP